MKNLILCATASMLLALSCVAPAGSVMIPTDGAFTRQVERVVERHDNYVMLDAALTGELRSVYLEQAQNVVELIASMPQGVPPEMISPNLAPVLDRHDAYVGSDLALDPLMRDTYLASTNGIRSLLTQARWSRQ